MTHQPQGDPDSVDAAFQILLQKRCKLIVVTRGKEGAIAVSREERWEQPTMARQVVDTTGAGDAFAAGFLYGWCQAEDVRLGLIFGCACGAAAVGQMGGSHPLPPDEINRCMLGITPTSRFTPAASTFAPGGDSPSQSRAERLRTLARGRAATSDGTPWHGFADAGVGSRALGLGALSERRTPAGSD